MRKTLIKATFILLFLILSAGIMTMPTSPDTNAPSYNDTVRHYLENAIAETGATNVIAAIVADYRGFDTLGETVVLFTAIVAVGSALRVPAKKDEVEITHE